MGEILEIMYEVGSKYVPNVDPVILVSTLVIASAFYTGIYILNKKDKKRGDNSLENIAEIHAQDEITSDSID